MPQLFVKQTYVNAVAAIGDPVVDESHRGRVWRDSRN